jgi:pilus assembly protein CpaC
MIMKKLFQATAIGLSLCIGTFATTVSAEILQIVRNGGESSIDVPMNRAIVVESDIPFAELSIANPSIADFSTLSDRTVYVLGKTPGQTTLTLLDAQGRLISNVNVIVTPEISEFKLRLRQILPN